MATVALTDARIRELKPRRSAHDISNARLKEFGVQVLQSGGVRHFVHCQH